MSPDQRALIKKAERSIDAARMMFNAEMTDFAASRAYYAMFYLAEAFLEDEAAKFSSHAATIGEFGRRFAKTGRLPAELHKFLIDAQDARTAGDYLATSMPSKETAMRHILNAERFLAVAIEKIGRP